MTTDPPIAPEKDPEMPEQPSPPAPVAGAKRSFWARQTGPNVTKLQMVVDVLFGIVMPVVCVWVQLAIMSGDSIFGAAAPFAYDVIGLAMFTLALWLLFGKWLDRQADLFAVVLELSAIVALGMGVMLAPLSLLALMLSGLGLYLLGFVPFVTAFVYFRNAKQAYARARQRVPASAVRQIVNVALGVAFLFGLPAAVQWQSGRIIDREVQVIANGDQAAADGAVEHLKRVWCLPPIACFEPLRALWLPEVPDDATPRDQTRRLRIEGAYQKLTGRLPSHPGSSGPD